MFGCLAVYVAWGTAGIEIGSKERGEIVEAGSQERREESQEVVTRTRSRWPLSCKQAFD